MKKRKKKFLYTLGHSTRSTREFIKILKSYGVEKLIDVRHYPGSRHCPQFGKSRLKATLKRHNIEYLHFISLGGRRRVMKGVDVNSAWRNAAFRGYADYMQTKEFKEGLKELMDVAKTSLVAIMCSEAVPWRCHRSLVSDSLIVRKFEVHHIFSATNAKPHTLTSFAKVNRNIVTYPALQA